MSAAALVSESQMNHCQFLSKLVTDLLVAQMKLSFIQCCFSKKWCTLKPV